MNPEMFWSKVSRPSGKGCWLWMGARSGKYGSVRGWGRTVSAHRYAYIITFDRLPSPGVDVCHHCDTPLCVRPSHLFLGTRADNMLDAREKGRLADVHPEAKRAKGLTHGRFGNPHGTLRGSDNGYVRLTEGDVREIRRLLTYGWGSTFVAGAFNVSPSTITAIKTGQNWAWLA